MFTLLPLFPATSFLPLVSPPTPNFFHLLFSDFVEEKRRKEKK
jgi:hypothetical protein